MKIPITHLTLFISLGVLFMACSTTETNIPKEQLSPPPPISVSEPFVKRAAEALNVSMPTSKTAETSCFNEATRQVAVVGQDPTGSGQYAFEPTNLTFSKGECVEFTLTGQSEFHTFTIEELEIDQSMEAGESVKFAFTFTTPGQFTLICIPHEDQGMVGKITIQ